MKKIFLTLKKFFGRIKRYIKYKWRKNMDIKIPLTKPQSEIMKEFYQIPATKVIFNKNERNNIWKLSKARKIIPSRIIEIYRNLERKEETE